MDLSSSAQLFESTSISDLLHTYIPKLDFADVANFVCIECELQCDLLDMPAVKQLGRDSKYAPVYRLLEIFLTGRLSDYLEFQAADATTLKNYGMNSSLAIFFHDYKLVCYSQCSYHLEETSVNNK